MLTEKLAQFGKSQLIEEIHDEFEKVIREWNIAPFSEYAIVALKKK
jgi:hypothetical protein